MKIRLRGGSRKTYIVYAVYWGFISKKFLKHHYVIEPEDGVGGFSPLGEDEIVVVDKSLDNYSLIKEEPGIGDMLVHNATLPIDNLFYYLSENGYPEKVEELFQNMRKMGLEP